MSIAAKSSVLIVAGSMCLLAAVVAGKSLSAGAERAPAASIEPAPEFVDARRLPLLAPLRAAERAKRQVPPAADALAAADGLAATVDAVKPSEPGAPANPVAAAAGVVQVAIDSSGKGDERLIAEAEEATQRALEERVRSAEVRRRAEELSRRFAKDAEVSAKPSSHHELHPSTAEAATSDTEDPVAADGPRAPGAAASSKAAKAKAAKAQRTEAKAGKVRKERAAAMPPPAEPEEEGLLSKVKSGLSNVTSALFSSW